VGDGNTANISISRIIYDVTRNRKSALSLILK
jgi:hypothetical protein